MAQRLLLLPLLALLLVVSAAAQAAANPPGALRFFADPGPPPGGPDPLLGGCIARALDPALGTQRCDSRPGRGLDGAYGLALSPDADGAGPRPAAERLYVAATDADAVAVLARDPSTGALAQADDPATAADEACIAADGRDGCVAGAGLDEAIAVAVSPDGRWVYAASRRADAVAVMRVTAEGSLTQAGLDDPATPGNDACISEGGAGGCVAGRGLDHAIALAVSPDGRTVYAAGRGSDAVAVLRARASGGLAQAPGSAGCLHDPTATNPAPPDGCASARALNGATGLALAPGGRHLYVTSRRSDALAAFAVAPGNGRLTQLRGRDGCVARRLAGCGRSLGGLNGARAVALDATGRSAYVAAERGDSLLALSRDPGSGRLRPLRCYSDAAEAALCTDAPALDGATSVAVSPDGGDVYVGARGRSAVGIFRRLGDGSLRVEPPAAGDTWSESCLSLRGHTWRGEQDLSAPDHSDHRCARSLALFYPYDVVVSPDGRDVYAAAFRSDAVTRLRRLAAGAAWAPDDRAPGTHAAGPRGRVRSRTAGFVVAPLGGGPAVIECRIDREPWRRCANPVTRRRIPLGRHVFQARAVDPSGNADTTPARVVWRVVRRR